MILILSLSLRLTPSLTLKKELRKETLKKGGGRGERKRTFWIRNTKLPKTTVVHATTQPTAPDGNLLLTTSFLAFHSTTGDCQEVRYQSFTAVLPVALYLETATELTNV